MTYDALLESNANIFDAAKSLNCTVEQTNSQLALVAADGNVVIATYDHCEMATFLSGMSYQAYRDRDIPFERNGMSECEEVAESMAKSLPRELLPSTMREARDIVRGQMPDETEVVIDNTSEALLVISKQAPAFQNEEEVRANAKLLEPRGEDG